MARSNKEVTQAEMNRMRNMVAYDVEPAEIAKSFPEKDTEVLYFMWVMVRREIHGPRSNPRLPAVTVRRTKRGFVFCRTVSAAETRQMAKLFEGVRSNPGHFPGKLGTGSRFAACQRRVESFYARKGQSVDSGAVCASIGRHAYGPRKFKKLSVSGRRNPYRSRAQQRLFHALAARGEISPEVVREYDLASKGKRLPQYVKTRRNPTEDPAGDFIVRAYLDPFVRKTLTPALTRRLARELSNHTYDRREALDLWKQWVRAAANGIPGTTSPALVNEIAHRMMVHYEATS